MRLSEHERQQLIHVLREYGIPKAAIFGSFARGEATPASDLDLLIERPTGFTLFQLGGLYHDLEAALAHSVDIVMYGSIHPKLEQRILSSAQELYSDGLPG